MEEDRRCGIRWPVSLPVRYRSILSPSEGCCQTMDISTSGARLAIVERYKPGDQLSMVLDIPDAGRGPVCVEADVVWQTSSDELHEECNYLTGVVFRKIRDCHKKSILDYVNVNHPQMFRERWWDGV